MRFRYALPLLFIALTSTAFAQQQPPQNVETRLKTQLGELLFSVTMLGAENEMLRTQVQELTRVNREMREKYEPKPAPPPAPGSRIPSVPVPPTPER